MKKQKKVEISLEPLWWLGAFGTKERNDKLSDYSLSSAKKPGMLGRWRMYPH